jgi:GH24 family phage-related lysozyme (muramidase)
MGVGHLLTDEEKSKYPVGSVITRGVSQEFLERDLRRFENAINNLVKVPLNQNQFDALVSFAFNVGEANFKRSSVLRHLNAGLYAKAAEALLAWNKSKGKVLAGLTRRREEERELFLQSSGADVPPVAENPPSAVLPDTSPMLTPETLPDTVEVPKYTEIAAPKDTGGTEMVKSWSWKLPSLTVIVTFLISTVESLVSKGYFDAKDVGEKLYVFFVVNWRYAVYLGIAAISYLAIKKILSYVPPIIESVTESHPDLKAIKFKRND